MIGEPDQTIVNAQVNEEKLVNEEPNKDEEEINVQP